MSTETYQVEVVQRTGTPSGEPDAVSRERELSAIVTHMWDNAENLARQEMKLGLKEIDLRVDRLKQALIFGSVGGLTVYAGILVLLAAAVLGLATVMAPWLAALIVGGLVTAGGATMLMRGEQKAEGVVKPDEHSRRTVRAMKEAVK